MKKTSMLKSSTERGGKLEIIDWDIEWELKWANRPNFVIFVDGDQFAYYPYSTVPHKLIDGAPGNGLFLATDDPWAHFVADRSAIDGPHMRGQCVGDLLLESGHKLRIVSGWSSRAGVINTFLPEADHIIDVTVKGDDERMARDGLAVRLDVLKDRVERHGLYIVKDEENGDITYYPSIEPDRVVKPKKAHARR